MLLSAITLRAESSTTKLVLFDKNGQKYEYILDTKPKLMFAEDQLLISVSGVTVYFNLNEMARFSYENAAVQTNVVDVVTDNNYIYNGNTLIFPSLPANSKIRIYNLSGILILSKDIANAGEYALPLNDLEAGNYLVNVNNKTIKVFKK